VTQCANGLYCVNADMGLDLQALDADAYALYTTTKRLIKSWTNLHRAGVCPGSIAVCADAIRRFRAKLRKLRVKAKKLYLNTSATNAVFPTERSACCDEIK
jgi:hypothetical protein